MTVWPLVYIFVFFGFISFAVVAAPIGQPDGERAFSILFALHILTIFVLIALAVVYVVHVFRNARLPESQKTLWVIVLILGGPVAMPIYWYLYFWRRPA